MLKAESRERTRAKEDASDLERHIRGPAACEDVKSFDVPDARDPEHVLYECLSVRPGSGAEARGVLRDCQHVSRRRS